MKRNNCEHNVPVHDLSPCKTLRASKCWRFSDAGISRHQRFRKMWPVGDMYDLSVEIHTDQMLKRQRAAQSASAGVPSAMEPCEWEQQSMLSLENSSAA